MKLVTFTHHGTTRLGVVMDAHVVNLAAGVPALAKAREAAAGATAKLPLADVHLEAPIRRPPKFLAIGLDYADHIKEAGMEKPKDPVFFNKQSTCVAGPYDPVHLPRPLRKGGELVDGDRGEYPF